MKPSTLDIKQLEDIATLKADMRTVKSDLKDVKKKIEDFIDTADKKYATKEELANIKVDVRSNTDKIWHITKDIATLGTAVALVTKLVGLW